MAAQDRFVPTPHDPWNARLAAEVHPADWRNPEPASRYALVVIGAGTAGLVTAAGAAGLGARVALVERRWMGGDCLNVGCVPSKTLLRSARAAAELRAAAPLGVGEGLREGAVRFADVMERVRRVRARIAPHDSARRFRDELGVDVFFGDARFVGPDRVAVGGSVLRFRRAAIATGARPAMPPIPGLAEAEPLTNETVFSLTERPERLLVLGGGPIGCELAQAFARLGTRVTVLEMEERFLAREDPEAAAAVLASLERDGVDVRLGRRLERVVGAGADRRGVAHGSAGVEEIPFDAVLVAVGRVPNVEGLDLEAAGVAYDGRLGVTVDDRLRTGNRRVYAVGDVCMAQKFTHAADAAARIVIQNALFADPLLGLGSRRLSALTIPHCTYTDPELAQVGPTEAEARARGLEVDVYTRRFDEVDRALTEGEEEGFVKILVARGRDRIVGATVVGVHAGDLVSEISVAMHGGVGLGRLASVIHPYPTRAEAIRQLGDARNRARLTPRMRRLLQLFLRWRS
jgi:pyruvate/2-oxoglutarate dehydrogenase complex dihydrolipoamide dehydrogenase (E3) component